MNIAHSKLKLRISWCRYMTWIFNVNCLTLLSLNKANRVKFEMKRESNTSKFANSSSLLCTTNLSIEADWIPLKCLRTMIFFVHLLQLQINNFYYSNDWNSFWCVCVWWLLHKEFLNFAFYTIDFGHNFLFFFSVGLKIDQTIFSSPMQTIWANWLWHEFFSAGFCFCFAFMSG